MFGLTIDELITPLILVCLALFVLWLVSLRPIVRWEASKWCQRHNLDFVSMEILGYPHGEFRDNMYHLPKLVGRILVEYRRKGSSDIEVVYASWHPAFYPRLEFENPDKIMQRKVPSPAEIGFEREVRLETTRRLNEITSKVGWAAQYDLDGSGRIEQNEWEILKDRVEAEVRAEKGGTTEPAEEPESIW